MSEQAYTSWPFHTDETAARPHRLQAGSMLVGGVTLCVMGAGSMVVGALFGSASELLVPGLIAWCLTVVAGGFHLHLTRDDLYALPRMASASVVATVATALGDRITGHWWMSMAEFAGSAVFALVGLVLGTAIGRTALTALWRRDTFRTTALVVGGGEVSRQIGIELAHRPELGIDVVDHVDLTTRDGDTAISDLVGSIRRHRPDRLIVGEVPGGDDEPLVAALRFAVARGTRVYVLPRLFEMGLGNPLFTPDRLRGYPLLRVNRAEHPSISATTKRIFDVGVAGLGLVLLSPVLAACAVAVKLTSPGSVLFWQDRVGLDGKIFRVPKFRSMTGGETGDIDWTADARITPVGRVLRRCALDELPQLWSIVRGDMSLVGPRPERPVFAAEFSESHPHYAERHRMRAGLTGLSQIAGLRGDTSIAERAKYDNLYIDQWSFTGDLVILARTIVAIVREGTYSQAQQTLSEVIALDESEPLDLRSTRNQSSRSHTPVHDQELNKL